MRRGAAAMSLFVVLLASCSGCGDGSPPFQTAKTFLFGMRGIPDAEGQFVAVTSDPAVLANLQAQLALPDSDRGLHIHGPIARGSGGHNLSWSWHFIPGEWDMVEVSAESCDGSPKQVEGDIDYWVDTVKVFCPWGSYVQKEI